MVIYNGLIKTIKLESTFYVILWHNFSCFLRFGEFAVMFENKIMSINLNDNNIFFSLLIRHIFSDFTIH